MAYNWPGNVRELKRFASLVAKNSTKISKPGGHLKSVLLWFESYRGLDQGMDSPIHTEGVPDFQSLSEFKKLFTNNKALLNEIDVFVDILSSGEKLFDTVTLVQQSLKKGDFDIDCKNEWLDWCTLLCQNPYNEKDIFECILNREATGRRYKHHNRFDEDSLNDKYDNLALKLYQTLYSPFYQKGNKEIKNIDGFSSALTLVLDKLSPKEYRDAWIKYCLRLGIPKTAEKYNMNKRTVDSVFRRYKENSEEK
jgi:hypothetical protein